MVYSPKNKQEDKILKKAVQGDPSALADLVKSHSDLAYTVAIKIVNSSEDAEEVVQDSFLKAFRSLHEFKKSSKFSTWLYRIVYNTALTKVKGKRNTTAYVENQLINENDFNIQNKGWDTLLLEERAKFIDLAMRTLSSEDRSIFTLHYIGDKTIKEIGDIVKLKKSAIKMRLLRGRKQLRDELKLVLGNETNDLL